MTITSDQVHLEPEATRQPVDAFHRQPAVQVRAAAAGARARACTTGTTRDARSSTRIAGMWCSNLGHNHPKVVEAIRNQAAVLDYAPPFQMANPLQFELANLVSGITPAGTQQGLLHQFRIGKRRHRAQDRARLPPGAGRRLARAPDRPRARLSRRGLRRHFGGGHGRQPQDVRLVADRRRSPAADLESGRAGLQPWPACLGRASRRRTGAHRRAARRVHHRRRHRRAGGGQRRRAGAAGRLPGAAARDLHPPRHPADLRRGHHRLRTPRQGVRRRILQGPAGPHDAGQGHHLRHGADGRGGGAAIRSTRRS